MRHVVGVEDTKSVLRQTVFPSFRTNLGGDAETPFHFEMLPKCLKFGHPDLQGLIHGTSDLRLCGVPYGPYGRMRPKFQTHAPSFEVNGPLAVPVAPRGCWISKLIAQWILDMIRAQSANRAGTRAKMHVAARSVGRLHAKTCVSTAIGPQNARPCVASCPTARNGVRLGRGRPPRCTYLRVVSSCTQ